MAEHFTIPEIPWALAEYTDPDSRRLHFLKILRTIQSGCIALTADMTVFQDRLEAQSSLSDIAKPSGSSEALPDTKTRQASHNASGLLMDPRSQQFLEALLYHVAAFQRALKYTEGLIDSKYLTPGISKAYDLEVTLQGTSDFIGMLSSAVEDLRLKWAFTSVPYAQDKFVGSSAPTAAPRELLLSLVWTQKFRDLNRMALTRSEPLTELQLKETLSQLVGYPNFQKFMPEESIETEHDRKQTRYEAVSDGVSKMFFICLGTANASSTGSYRQHIKIGATIPVWKSFPEFAQMCREARDSRFGPDEVSKIKKAIDALVTFETQHYEAASKTLLSKSPKARMRKADRTNLKVDARLHAIKCMRHGPEEFINHLGEVGQAYGGVRLEMKLACYCCQGIFGYSNVKEASDKELPTNITRYERSKDDYDHHCAEAATSLQCKAVTTPVPYQDSLPYA